MGLKIAFHGGKCCGIKTIHGFSFKHNTNTNPDYDIWSEKPLVKGTFKEPDSYAEDVSSSMNFFTDKAPREPQEKRLDRYLDFIKTRRARSLVEIALVVAEGLHTYSQNHWITPLEKKGFKEVSRFKNSNSGNDVAVFHLDMSKYKKKTRAKKKAAAPAPFQQNEGV